MTRKHVSRGTFLRGAAGLAGVALAAGQGGIAGAQATPEGLASGRPIRGRLLGSSSGRTVEYAFDYPGGEAVYTIEMQVMPESVFPLAGFRVYNPTGGLHVTGGAQATLVPNVSANVVSRQRGRYVVQVYNSSRDNAIDYWVRVVSGVREGEIRPAAGPSLAQSAAAPMIAYVGSYMRAPRRGEGIYVFAMDPSTGAWTRIQTVTNVDDPSFLAIDHTRRFLYASEEIADYRGKNDGSIAAFAIDQATGTLSFLNRVSAGGAIPAHLVVDPSNRFLVVANYIGANNAVLPIREDGSLGEPSDVATVSSDLGLGPMTTRQDQPHPHMIPFDPSGRFVLVPDLGLDRTLVYRFNAGKLVANDTPWAMASKAGAGPRHLAFHPSGTYAYVINELNATIDAFGWDPERGALRPMQTVPTLPPGFDGTKSTAEIVVAPSGQFLYGSNRGHDSLVIYAIDPTTGLLTLVGWESTQGRNPRNFNIDPTGSYLYAANQSTDNITAYWIDQATGRLNPLGQIEAKTPVCIVFAT